MDLPQLPAACSSSAAVNEISSSFSASANVLVETAGPTDGAVPNAGGAPAGRAVSFAHSPGFGDLLLSPHAAAIKLIDVAVMNCRRDFFMGTLPLEGRDYIGKRKARMLVRSIRALF